MGEQEYRKRTYYVKTFWNWKDKSDKFLPKVSTITINDSVVLAIYEATRFLRKFKNFKKYLIISSNNLEENLV